MKRLIIFTGHPAGGKTTTAYRLADLLGHAKVIEVDKVKIRISGSVFGKSDEEREQWFVILNAEIKENLKKFDTVIVDEGFFAKEYYNKMLVGVNRKQVKILVIEITFEFGEHLKRHELRQGGPDLNDSVRHMYDLWQSVPAEEKIPANLTVHDKNLSIDQIVGLISKYIQDENRD